MQHVCEASETRFSMLIQIVDNTNLKHLELYTILREYDNASFPLSYCLLSTMATTELGKRTKALTAWGTALREKYRVIPQFVHIDKDMAEIVSCRKTWSQAKIQLCWWHLHKAVRTRLQLAKLSITPYNIEHAQGNSGSSAQDSNLLVKWMQKSVREACLVNQMSQLIWKACL